MIEVGIVGGGPGGLVAARHLAAKCGGLCKATILEASNRLGGKLVTLRFPKTGIVYEAGVAEIYDYTEIGPDPLAETIAELGLKTIPMDSDALAIGDVLVSDLDGVEQRFGHRTRRAIERFRSRCAKEISPIGYYESLSKDDNAHPWAKISGHDLLHREVDDDMARHILRIAAHSDIAAPPHLTNGLNTIKNVLMDVDGYIRLKSIEGGIERLTTELAARTEAAVELDARALRVGRADDGRYEVEIVHAGRNEVRRFDILILALPLNWLATLQWSGAELERAMSKHVAHFDRPGHYVRVSIAFERPFWRDHVRGSWWMSDAFNGCCVYDEGSRHDVGDYGVLGWLIAGNDALALANVDDATLARMAIDSLPSDLRDVARAAMIESVVHRWLATVNAIPGGRPVRDTRTNHLPEPYDHPGLFVVGDYMFDATINGVFDSADAATDLALGRIVEMTQARMRAETAATPAPETRTGKRRKAAEPPAARRDRVDRAYFDDYRGLGRPYAEVWRQFFDAEYIADVARIAWGLKNGFRILDAGAASGLTVGAMRDIGLDAWGIEKNAYVHGQTAPEVTPFNLIGDVTRLPFPDNHFDVVYETCLDHLSEVGVEKALAEFHRVARKGVIFGSVTSEIAAEDLGTVDYSRGMKRLGTWWEWSDLFFDHDFELALEDQAKLDAAWDRTQRAGNGAAQQFEDAESLRYALYSKV